MTSIPWSRAMSTTRNLMIASASSEPEHSSTGSDGGPPATILLATLSFIASATLAFSFAVEPIIPGVDPAYTYAFNYAATHIAQWGTTFVSTFGPYGFVLATMDVGDLIARRLAFSTVYVIALAAATVAYVRTIPGVGPIRRLVTAVGLIYAVSLQPPDYLWFTLFLIVVFAGVMGTGWTQRVAYPAAGVLAGDFLLMKFSLGLGALLTLGPACLITRRPAVAVYRVGTALAATAVSFVLFWLVAGGAMTDIGG
jgi:hypothetical protein